MLKNYLPAENRASFADTSAKIVKQVKIEPIIHTIVYLEILIPREPLNLSVDQEDS